MQQYDTLTEALADLRTRGYIHDYNLGGDCLHCPAMDLRLNPEQFHIREYYRFEGPNDPADASVVYAIESDLGVRGVLVNAYGMYADGITAELAHKLRLHP